MEKDLDRRQFLTGAGVLAAAGVVGSLAASSSLAIANEAGSGGFNAALVAPVSSAPASDGIGSGDRPYPWSTNPPAIAASDIEEELDCDVLVAGTGIAGSCAIRAAAEGGAKVIYCDKQGGVSSSSGDIAVFGRNDDSVQAAWGRVNAYDWDMIVDHEMDEGSYFPKRAIWRDWAFNNGDIFQWYISSYPDYVVAKDEEEGMAMMGRDAGILGWIKPNFYPAPEGYDPLKETHPCFLTSLRCDQLTFNQKCVEIAEGLGAQGFFEHAITQVFKEGDRVAGGYIYNYNTGKYKKVNASKGVILCTGDYAGNKTFEAYFLPDVFRNNNPSMGGGKDPDGDPLLNGDHLPIGDWAGATIQSHHAPMIHHMGAFFGGWGGIAPYLRLNMNGYRFMNEDCPGQQYENQVEIQPNQQVYMLWDADWKDCVHNFPPMHGSFITYDDSPDAAAGGPGSPASQAGLDSCVEAGTVVSGNTIDELLNELDIWGGIDKEVAKAQIARYQELCDKGKDEDFNKNPSRMTSFKNPPFYAVNHVLASNLVDLGGLNSDEFCHTFTADGKVLKGLYVGGNTQGNRFTVQYPIALEGAASSLAMWGGYVAGVNAAAGV